MLRQGQLLLALYLRLRTIPVASITVDLQDQVDQWYHLWSD